MSKTLSTQPDHGKVTYAGFWIRVQATLIDLLWLTPLVLGMGFIMFGRAYFTMNSNGMSSGVDFFITNGLPALAMVGFWVWRGGTPGKLLLHLRIVDARTLGKPSFGQLVLRYLGYIPATMVLFLGLIWVAFDARKQGWHDKIARTVVIVDEGL